MFSGIVETQGTIKQIKKKGTNLHLYVQSSITRQLKIDQSIAHNGVCLTVVDIKKNQYQVTAIKETIDCSNIGNLRINEKVNLERSLRIGDRLDGHIVQGHVDTTAHCTGVADNSGSKLFTFKIDSGKKAHEKLMVNKGSICVNGVSLTIVKCTKNIFSVAIIPYTLEHTNFSDIRKGTKVNIEFDVVGKYILKSKLK